MSIQMQLYSKYSLFITYLVKTVKLEDLVEMCKTDSFGETRLVPHVPSSS